MNNQITPEFYYTFSEDFNYRKYLEERSHFDRVVISLDNQTSAIVGSSDRLAHRIRGAASAISSQIEISNRAFDGRLNDIDVSMLQINQTVNDGFTTLSMDMNAIESGIHDIHLGLMGGFVCLLDETKRNTELLGKVLSALNRPEQTWAEEQFSLAQKCVASGWWKDALEYCDKAINGDKQSKAGIKIEARFYFLRARIYEGLIGTDIKYVNLHAAKNDFLAAFRYAGAANLSTRKTILTRLGWCLYCAGEINQAKDALLEASFIDEEVPEAEFLLAKVFVRLGSLNYAKKPLIKAILQDSLFCFRVASDGDLAKEINTIRKWLSELKSQIFKELVIWRDKVIQIKQLQALFKLSPNKTSTDPNLLKIERALIILDKAPFLSDLIDLQKESHQLVDAKTAFVSFHVNHIERHISSVNQLKAKKPSLAQKAYFNGDVTATLSFLGVFLGGAVGLIVAFVMIYNEAVEDDFLFGILTWLFGLLIYGIPGLVIGIIAGLLCGLGLGLLRDIPIFISNILRNRKFNYHAKAKVREEEKNIVLAKREANLLSEELHALRKQLVNLI